MRRYIIPFTVGLILGVGTVPIWAATSAPTQAVSLQASHTTAMTFAHSIALRSI